MEYKSTILILVQSKNKHNFNGTNKKGCTQTDF